MSILGLLAAAVLLTACGPGAPPKAEPAVAKPEEPAPPHAIAQVYPTATSIRMFVASNVRVGKADDQYERRWLNPPKGFELSTDQQRRFRQALRDAPPPEGMFSCFVPHHFFRFYDPAGRQVGEIAICFCCSGASADPNLPLGEGRTLEADYKAVAEIVAELGASSRTDCSR